MHRYFIEIAYDGTEFAGWQKQPDVETVQRTIENDLSRLFSHSKVDIVGCGRTDAGVHASQFFFHVDLSDKYEANQLMYKLNNMLPLHIAVLGVHKVDSGAHARFDAESRTYRYFIHQRKDPFLKNFSWYFPQQLDIKQMNVAAGKLVGKKDFTSFSKLHTDVKTNVCDLSSAEWIQTSDHELYFEVTANRFLRNMVRAIVGTMIEVGLGNLSVADVEKIIKAQDRGEAGMSVPAKGLFLYHVEYPGIMQGESNTKHK